MYKNYQKGKHLYCRDSVSKMRLCMQYGHSRDNAFKFCSACTTTLLMYSHPNAIGIKVSLYDRDQDK